MSQGRCGAVHFAQDKIINYSRRTSRLIALDLTLLITCINRDNIINNNVPRSSTDPCSSDNVKGIAEYG
jgi:hypothetical protein